jgi:YnbE-like lipoprotein
MKLSLVTIFFMLVACTPRIELAPSDKPITINMNIKIDHEVKVKVEKDLEQVFAKDSNLF